MNIIAVDDETPGLFLAERAIRKAVPDGPLACFSSGADALLYAQKTTVDVAFLDIDMRAMNGLTLAQRLQEINSQTNIVFITGHSEYAVDAFLLGSSGYILKPVEPEAIALELSRLRNPPGAFGLSSLKQIGNFTFDHRARRVFHGGKDVLLHPREYNIFYLLATHPGQYFTPQELYEKASGQAVKDDTRALYVQMHRLRKKLGLDDGGLEKSLEIEQRRGKGYRLTIL